MEFRWRQHQHKDDGTYFHNALKKYGVENFIVETLEECEVSKLDSREIYYIAKYNTFEKGYNLTIGEGGKRKIVSDDQYEEIKELYLSGFSSNKIATLYEVDKATIVKILKVQGVKLRDKKKICINHQEFLELVEDYNKGYSLKELGKRYDCSASGLKEYLLKKGINLRDRYSLLEDAKTQDLIIKDFLDETFSKKDIMQKYHTSFSTLKKILSMHGIKEGKKYFKLTDRKSVV